jgi:Putative adhesin
MPSRPKTLVLTAIALLLAGCDPHDFGSFGDSHAYEKDFHYSYPLKPGGRLSVENFNGSVEITGWDKDTVEIDGRQYASTLELRDAIKIDVAASDGLVQIRTIRPGDRYGNMGARYTIRAPRKVNLDRIVTSNGGLKVDEIEGIIRLRTSNGSIRTARIRGDLDASTSNGGIDIDDLDGPANVRTSNGRVTAEGVRGSLQIATSNGSIHASVVKPEPHRPIKLQTSNGGIDLSMDSLADNEIRASTSNSGITVKLPSMAAAHIHAHTSHSSIHTDFEMKREEGDGKNSLDGIIGSGGPMVELTSSNGSIRLLKM